MKARARLLGSLRSRLALLFFAVTAVALAVVIFVFLPQLESKIERQKLGDLQSTAARTAPRLRGLLGAATGKQVDRAARVISDRTGARVTVLGIQRSSRSPVPRFYVISDSNQLTSVATDWPLAAQAVAPGGSRPRSRIVDHIGEVAVPLLYVGRPSWVAVYADDFGDAS